MDSQLSTNSQPLFVCTVGGSPAPIMYSLTKHAPKYALFLCSASSATAVEEQILPELPKELTGNLVHTVHILRDEQDLLACVRDMRAAVRKAKEAFGLGGAPLLADFTGGTKVMSAALVLALAEYNVHFTYIGGGQRSKNGLGTVIEGTERVMRLANPWDVLGFSPIRQLVDAFNFHEFPKAARIAEELILRGERAALFQGLAHLSEAYALWDGFDYSRARRALPKALEALETLGAQEKLSCPALTPLLAHVKKNCAELYQAADELAAFEENKSPCPSTLRDLAANALRREEQGRFDDASSRYYSLLEKGAKVELASRYGIDTSNVNPDRLPASFLRETPLVPSHDGRLQLPLFKAYLLLACLNNPLGLAFIQHKERLEQVLRIRNSSLLAHGFSPVDADTCGELRSLVFTFLDIRQDSLPLFPTLDTTLFG